MKREQSVAERLQALDPGLQFDDLQKHVLEELTAGQAEELVTHYRQFMLFIGDVPGIFLVREPHRRRVAYAMVLAGSIADTGRVGETLTAGYRHTVEHWAARERGEAGEFFAGDAGLQEGDLERVLGMAVRMRIAAHLLASLEQAEDAPGERNAGMRAGA